MRNGPGPTAVFSRLHHNKGISNCEFRIAHVDGRDLRFEIRNSQFEIRNSHFLLGLRELRGSDYTGAALAFRVYREL